MGEPEPEFCDDYFWSRRQQTLARTRASFPGPRYFRPVGMSKEIIEALEALVRYEWYSEMDDFLTSDEELQANHIFVSKLMLQDWLVRQPDFWIDNKRVLPYFLGIVAFLFFLPEIIWLGRSLWDGHGF